jgi:hypothetical protein
MYDYSDLSGEQLGQAGDRLDERLHRARAHPRLLLARRQALARLHPLDESSLGIADGPADADVGRAVAAHTRLCKPGEAHLEQGGRLLGGEEHDGGRGRLLRCRAAADRRLGCHYLRFPFGDDAHRDATTRSFGLSFAKVGNVQ